MNKYVTEFIGTFFLIFTVGCTVIMAPAGVAPALAIGSVLMVMVFAGGHISGAHYNPSITIAMWIRGKCLTRDVIPYIIAQAIAAVAATLAVQCLKEPAPITAMHLEIGRALLAEFIFTFALNYVVLNVATAKGTNGNSFYGLAIGFTVTAGVYAVGNISGGAFNPAVALGITLMGLSLWSNLWVYMLANFGGGIVAAIVFRLVNRADLSLEAIPKAPAT